MCGVWCAVIYCTCDRYDEQFILRHSVDPDTYSWDRVLGRTATIDEMWGFTDSAKYEVARKHRAYLEKQLAEVRESRGVVRNVSLSCVVCLPWL